MTEYYNEKFRPQYHFSPEKNWMNEPNGLVYFSGEYHLFYQYNPFGNKWGHMSWGHAVSKDLLHWNHLSPALQEENGIMIFSGSVVVDRKNSSSFGKNGDIPLIAVYTGHRTFDGRQFQCLAFSNDYGRSWEKYKKNPVLDLELQSFRDPKVFWHEESSKWVMIVALSAQRKIGFYGSVDLIHWNFLSDFGPRGNVNGEWECPDLLPLPVENDTGNIKWLLKMDLPEGCADGGSGGQYFIGEFDGITFSRENSFAKIIDYGKDFYAATSFSNVSLDDGRKIWLGWLSNWQYAEEVPTNLWRSAQSVPRSLSVKKSSAGFTLMQHPLETLNELRLKEYSFDDLLISGEKMLLPDARLLEIYAELQIGTARECGFYLRKGADEYVRLGYHVEEACLFIDREKSGLVKFNKNFSGLHKAPLTPEDGIIRIHLFLDRSSLEVFGNDGEVVISDLIFPGDENRMCTFYADGGAVKIVSMKIRELASVWH